MPKSIAFIFSAAAAALASFTAQAQSAGDKFGFEHVSCKGGANEIRVIVSGVKKPHGLISVDLYPNKEEGFLHKRGRIKQVTVAAKAPETKFCMTAPETGLFAMSAYQDRNANAIFDKTGLGLPDEPWGLSNNPKVRFGPPPIEKTLFDVEKNGAKVEIKLH